MMNKTIATLALAGFTILGTLNVGAKGIQIVKNDGETLHIDNTLISTMTFSGDDAVLTSTDGQQLVISRDAITSVSQISKVASSYTVSYDADGAKVVNPYSFKGVTTVIDGGYVTTTNTNESEELKFSLSGTTTDGSYLYNGTYKCTLELNGVNITSQRGAAIDVQCGKRIAVVLAADTQNTLSDYAEGTQKACFYIKGHPEFQKAGTLTVTGNCNHAISSKEYIQLKASMGTINILAAANDGIHAGQYFQMNGGIVNIDNVLGDGIQAETTSDETDEMNGQMLIKGGELTITVQAPTADCLKADNLIEISGGTFNLTTTGDGIEDSTTTTSALRGPGGPGGGNWPGGGGGSSVETSSPKCINGGGDLTITGGTFTARSTGKGGKGFVCDGVLTIGDENYSPIINCSTTGTAVAGSGDNLSGLPKAIKAEGDIIINSGTVSCYTSQNGGEGIESKASITINGGTVLCNTYDDGINAATKITVNGGVVWSWGSNNDGMDCNGSQGFEFNGGIVVANGTTSPEEGFDCDNYSFAIKGGTILGIGGATSSVTSATQPYASTSGVSVTANKYLSMVDANGKVLLSYLCPKSMSATVVSSSPGYGNNTSCKLVYGVTSVSDPTETYMDGRILVGGTLTGGTSKSITPKTK